MGEFVITQERESEDLWLLPNNDGCHQDFSPHGDTNNYECVDDPRLLPDDDTTYTYGGGNDPLYDLYALPNHTTESGTINYVRIYLRGKVNQIAPGSSTVYKAILTEDNCSNIYKSDNLDILTGYKVFNWTWTENPRTDAAWTWDDIDNLQIGWECSSPSLTAYNTAVYRPTANGTFNGNFSLFPNTGESAYEDVDDTVADDDETYVYTRTTAFLSETYEISDVTYSPGVIDRVRLFLKTRNDLVTAGTIFGQIYTHDHSYFSDIWQPELFYQIYSCEWESNPSTGVPWTWAEIQDLEIGMRMQHNIEFGGGDLRVTQVYLLVDYHTYTNPEIRTTQAYAKVNYSPPDSTCTMNMPSKITVDQTEIVKMLNFWSGNRAVYGLHRGGKRMVCTGMQIGTDACTVMECVRGMAENGSEIDITGLGNSLFNDSYRIISFGYEKVSVQPLVFRYILECEYAS